jgi:hypothetical protein
VIRLVRLGAPERDKKIGIMSELTICSRKPNSGVIGTERRRLRKRRRRRRRRRTVQLTSTDI